MRLDLFLKSSGLVRRRSLAQEMCEMGLVLVNGAPAKPGKEVRAGDVLELRFPRKVVLVRVSGFEAFRSGRERGLFEVLSEERRGDVEEL